jgi:hypothetical protein
MHSTVKPKQADDPHDLLAVAPDVVQVAPSGPGDPTDEELSSLLRAAARQRSDAQTRRSDGATGPSAPAVDTTFRPAAVNHVRGVRSSMRTRMIRGVIGFVLALCIVVGAAGWQSYGDAARQMVATWVPQLAHAPSASPQGSGLAEQPSSPAVQASEEPAAPEQSAQSAAQGVAPVAAASPTEAPTLQSMVRDVAVLGQKVEQLKATIEQLKASQEQMARDVAKGSEAKVSEQSLRPKTPPPAQRPAVVPARKPIQALRQPQATAAPVSPPPPAPYYGQRQPEPLPPAAQLVDPESSSVPRPPMPLHQ